MSPYLFTDFKIPELNCVHHSWPWPGTPKSPKIEMVLTAENSLRRIEKFVIDLFQNFILKDFILGHVRYFGGNTRQWICL